MKTNHGSVSRPTLPDRADLIPLPVDALEDEPTLEGALIQNEVITGDRLSNGMIDRSILEGMTIIEATADALIVRHAGVNRCDWSNTSAESSSWSSTHIDGSKLTGTKLNRAVLKDVIFTDCRADFIQFQNAKLQRVVFDSCNLQHAFFNGARLPKTVFKACDLTNADFSGADIKGSDLRRSRIEGIRIGPEQLRGVTVTQDQALYLATLMGLLIRD